MKHFVRFLVLSFTAVLVAAATETGDLGDNLAYLRVRSLAESIPAVRSAVAGSNALVLDLRHTVADDNSLPLLQTALSLHPAGIPLFVLVSPATPRAVSDAVNSTARVVSLGVAHSPGVTVVVAGDGDTDRRAYEALDHGVSLQSLISGKVEKERFDEATLVEEFKAGNTDAAPPPAPGPTLAKPDLSTKPAPLIDRVLQRAVQLHRALLALRR